MKDIKCIKNKYHSIQKRFSAPLNVYLIILAVSIVLMLSQTWWSCDFTKNALANIGYSLLASWMAAILVDYGNNKIQNKKQLKEFKQLIDNHNLLANSFFVTICGMYEEKYKPQTDITFAEMIDNILDPSFENYGVSQQDHEECVSEIISFLKSFDSESRELKETLVEHIENPYCTGYFRIHLDMIAYYARDSLQSIEMNNTDWAAERIIYKLFPTIVEIYPEMEEDYYS